MARPLIVGEARTGRAVPLDKNEQPAVVDLSVPREYSAEPADGATIAEIDGAPLMYTVTFLRSDVGVELRCKVDANLDPATDAVSSIVCASPFRAEVAPPPPPSDTQATHGTMVIDD